MDKGSETMEYDQRKWHVSKEIPVALIVSIACSLFLGGIAYQSLKGEQISMGKQVGEIVARLDKTDGKVDRLSEALQNGSVPSALNGARITTVEQALSEVRTALSEIRARLVENERQIATETLRSRASRLER